MLYDTTFHFRALETLKEIQKQKSTEESKIQGAAVGRRRKSKRYIQLEKVQNDVTSYKVTYVTISCRNSFGASRIISLFINEETVAFFTTNPTHLFSSEAVFLFLPQKAILPILSTLFNFLRETTTRFCLRIPSKACCWRLFCSHKGEENHSVNSQTTQLNVSSENFRSVISLKECTFFQKHYRQRISNKIMIEV